MPAMAEPQGVDAPTIRPGGRLRFGGEARGDLRSTDWEVWTGRRVDDVYVAGRDASNWIKASLHASGDWRHGFVTSLDDADESGMEHRHFERWPRPPEIAPGVTLAVQICIPTSQLRPGPATMSAGRDRVYTVPPPDDGNAVIFDVYLANDEANTALASAMPVGRLPLASGEQSALVVARSETLEVVVSELYHQQVEDARREVLAQEPLAAGTHGRIVVHILAENVLVLTEVAVDL